MLPPHANNPFVDPTWRHLRALDLVAHGRRADHPRDDELSRDAWRFCRALHGRTTENRRRTLARKMPAHFEAYTFFASTDLLTRAELEARLLAGQDDAAIAARCGLSPAAVGVYHAVYFAVRPRLDCEGYVLNVVLGSRLHGRLTDKDRDLILKLVAFRRGPVALDALLVHYAQPPLSLNDLKRLDKEALLALGDRLRCQALVHSLTMTSDRRSLRTAVLLQDLLGRLRAAEEEAPQMRSTSGVLDGTAFGRPQAVGQAPVEATRTTPSQAAVGLGDASAAADDEDACQSLRVAPTAPETSTTSGEHLPFRSSPARLRRLVQAEPAVAMAG